MKNIILIPIVGIAIMMLQTTQAGKWRAREIALVVSVLTLIETIRLYVEMDKSAAGFQHIVELN
jgi:NADH:ubiquinone oxidoreductase subunit 4 (subunit M)